MRNRAFAYLLMLFSGVFATSSAVSAQPADLPTPEALFAAAAQAHGWDKLKPDLGTIEAHADVTVGDVAYETIVRGAVTEAGLGNATFTLIREGGTSVYSETNGDIHYTSPDGTVKQLAPVMAAYVRGHQFHRRVLYPTLELATYSPNVEEVEFEGRPAFKVSGQTHAGATLEYYFDERLKTMLGFHLTVQEPDGPHPMSFVLKDWRDVDGSDIFYQIEIVDRGDLYVYRFSKILLLP
ncbi:hypothetical protein [Kordiimonas aestuarii]|uniref:hypothetical protein n=1 Tax=Kordiimonas aestuarii TaxID=1005925 RepID=UPI0021CFD9E4|nr:hypothetical protein [Kordiimonas aestuarii]